MQIFEALERGIRLEGPTLWEFFLLCLEEIAKHYNGPLSCGSLSSPIDKDFFRTLWDYGADLDPKDGQVGVRRFEAWIITAVTEGLWRFPNLQVFMERKVQVPIENLPDPKGFAGMIGPIVPSDEEKAELLAWGKDDDDDDGV